MSDLPRSRVVLVVMDDDDLSEIVQDALRAEGYAVLAANRGSVALELMRREGPPALILLDSWKPGMPGTFLQQLRLEPALATVPVVLCTTYKRFAIPGIQGMLRMPFDLNELLLTVAEHCAGV